MRIEQNPPNPVSCLTRVLGDWVDATVTRDNEDGTFNLQTNETVDRNWYGVTPEEVHFGTREQLPSTMHESRYYTHYFNLTRMGGRDPARVARTITANDALDALGIAQHHVNDVAERQISRSEAQSGIALPPVLRRLLVAIGVRFDMNAFTGSWTERARQYKTALDREHCVLLYIHPNSPELEPPVDWADDLKLPDHQVVSLLRGHFGEWAAVFRKGDQDAAIYFCDDQWRLVAPSSAFFIWDLAQTGLAWHQHIKFNGGIPVARTDVGLRRDTSATPG